MSTWKEVCTIEELQKEKVKLVKGGIAVFHHDKDVYAIDNRCPHMGFPLHMGSLCDGILTCHWHHARFDIESGGTLDPWADDLSTYEVKIEDSIIYIHLKQPNQNRKDEYVDQLQKGLEQNLNLVIAKGIIGLLAENVNPKRIIEIGVQSGTKHRQAGWGRGLTTLIAMANVLPKLSEQSRIQALYQALVMVANECNNVPPKHQLATLPDRKVSADRLHAWYAHCLEVRDAQGAERVVLTAFEAGFTKKALSELLFSAVTDHYYMDDGHVFDFHNKAMEALERTDESFHSSILASLPTIVARADRSEEMNRWQAPVDFVSIVEQSIDRLATNIKPSVYQSFDEDALLHSLLSDEPGESIRVMTRLLLDGGEPRRVAQVVSLAAAERIVHFSTQNDFNDWNTVLHTFTHAHAVHEALNRSDDRNIVVRAIFHTAVSISLDAFLNIPSAKRPNKHTQASFDLDEFLSLFDQQQPVEEAAQWVMNYIGAGHDEQALLSVLGDALLQEDAGFHTLQMYEAACIEYDRWSAENSAIAERAKETILIAVTRYIAAHSPTSRELPRFANIAWRLHRGEKVFEEM